MYIYMYTRRHSRFQTAGGDYHEQKRSFTASVCPRFWIYAANWSGRLEFMKFVRASEDLIGKQLDYIRTRYVFTTDELCANLQ